MEAVLAMSSLGAALDGLVGRLLEHAGGRLDDDLALVLAQPRLLIRRTAPALGASGRRSTVR
jgi:hypothetical protein